MLSGSHQVPRATTPERTSKVAVFCACEQSIFCRLAEQGAHVDAGARLGNLLVLVGTARAVAGGLRIRAKGRLSGTMNIITTTEHAQAPPLRVKEPTSVNTEKPILLPKSSSTYAVS